MVLGFRDRVRIRARVRVKDRDRVTETLKAAVAFRVAHSA